MTLLNLSRLHVTLGTRRVLHDISLDVGAGELIGLIGPNGAGKSTLLKSVLGLVPSSGGIRIAGTAASRLSLRERAKHIAYLPQDREISWAVSVEHLVALGRTPHLRGFSGPGANDVALVESAMQRMEIAAFRHRSALELSGGERARVLIARALAQDAALLLADEPTAGLDPAHQIALMQSLANMVGQGTSVVVSLHDLGLAARWCTRLVLIHEGSIVADGIPADVLTVDHMRGIYGVETYLEKTAQGLIVQPVALVGTSHDTAGKR
ncbi:ABC transporter ATP-binding protein [Phyllobacterium myrsinacearum]|uniref:Iron complex transport system ATP-binding protein n=1 Tax=Phyllobacterium myrsinacearum TaxID=28101 RepID=A0A839ER23_9HYPH|nr:ABC transporter ATP-binding protein [Phyllobacterium myrsinacearum]MBA8879846.1 iron complex transport system ATP-binding protein [Phyllobacterium myrsinacearum]